MRNNQAGDRAQDYPVLSRSLLIQGEALIRLQKRSRDWVKRRIEVVHFIDRLTVERATTLDLEFSHELLEDFPTQQGRKLLPLKLIRRDHDVNVTVRDASGVSLTQLNREAERSLVAAGLVYKYRQCYERLGRALDKAVDDEDLFRKVFAEINFYGQGPHTLCAGPAEWAIIRGNYMDYRLVIAAVDVVNKPCTGAILRLVVSNPEPLWLSKPQARNGSSDQRRNKSVPIERFPRYRSWIDDYPIEFPIAQVEACESFHFELVAPAGIYVHDSSLEIETVDNGPYPLRDTDPYLDRAHFFCVIHKAWTRDEVIRESWAEFTLRPLDEGLTKGLFLAPLLSSAVLAVFFCTVGWSGAGLPGFSAQPFDHQPEAVTTVLLLGPTLLSSLMIKDNEHMMTTRILGNLRARVAVGGIATLAASVAFALKLTGRQLFYVLAVLMVTVLLVALINLISYLRSRWGSGKIKKELGAAGNVAAGPSRRSHSTQQGG